MGSMAKLKKKDELRYRKGSTNESVNCRYCAHFQLEYPILSNGTLLRVESRCQVFGIKESIRYRVRKDYTCNAQVLDEDRLDSSLAGCGRRSVLKDESLAPGG